MIQDTAIVTMADQYKVVYGLSNGIFLMSFNHPMPKFQARSFFEAEYP